MERRCRVRFTNFGPADDMDYWESDLRRTANDAVDAYKAKLANKTKKATTRRMRNNVDDDDFSE